MSPAPTPSSPRPGTPKGRPGKAKTGALTWFFRLVAVLLLVGAGTAAGLWLAWGRGLPSVSDLDVLEFSGQTRVYDRTGQLVGTLTPSLSSSGSVNRNLQKLSQISPWLQKAVVTGEDRRFYEHHGVDYIGIARGLLKGLLQNDLEGGSSITQQLVKNTLLSDLQSARTPERKFKEALLAYQVDRNFDKEKILGAYLNVIYWGDGGRQDIIGAGSAAQAYFRKNAADLNLAESVYLATIIPAPNRRYKDFRGYRPLMKSLLSRMVEDGRVTQAQADQAWRTPIYPAGWRIGWNDDGSLRSAVLERPSRLQENLALFEDAQAQRYPYLHYLQAVERELLPLIGRQALYGGGRIYTGMSLTAQRSAEGASLRAELPAGATLGLALLTPDAEVLALVGQKLTGGRPSDWNNATQARRQVGSSIKPLLYTLALSQGWKQSDTILDSPLVGTSYQPKNYDGRWTGRYVTLRYSLDHSLNLTTVRMAQELGLPAFETKLRELGLTPPVDAGLPLSIGTLEASPLQMAAAYVPFVNGGLYYAPTLTRKVEDSRGKVLYSRPAPQPRRVWDAQTAWLGLDMIRGVVNDLTAPQGGLATRALIPGWEVGGKTGTTNDVKDLWFAGVTPNVVGAVWVGNQEGAPLPSWALSGSIPTPVWQQAVSGALAGQPARTFQPPPGITYRVVRQVNMAFREAEADQEPVARDGRRQSSGWFGRPAQNQTSPAQNPQSQTTPPPAPDPVPSEAQAAPEPLPDPDQGLPDLPLPAGAAGEAGGQAAGDVGGTQDAAPPAADPALPEAAPPEGVPLDPADPTVIDVPAGDLPELPPAADGELPPVGN